MFLWGDYKMKDIIKELNTIIEHFKLKVNDLLIEYKVSFEFEDEKNDKNI